MLFRKESAKQTEVRYEQREFDGYADFVERIQTQAKHLGLNLFPSTSSALRGYLPGDLPRILDLMLKVESEELVVAAFYISLLRHDGIFLFSKLFILKAKKAAIRDFVPDRMLVDFFLVCLNDLFERRPIVRREVKIESSYLSTSLSEPFGGIPVVSCSKYYDFFENITFWGPYFSNVLIKVGHLKALNLPGDIVEIMNLQRQSSSNEIVVSSFYEALLEHGGRVMLDPAFVMRVKKEAISKAPPEHSFVALYKECIDRWYEEDCPDPGVYKPNPVNIRSDSVFGSLGAFPPIRACKSESDEVWTGKATAALFKCIVAAAQRHWPSASLRSLVLGLGGAGCNIVSPLSRRIWEGNDFIATDFVLADAEWLELDKHYVPALILPFGEVGRGCFARPEDGADAARASAETIGRLLQGYSAVVLVAGLGGGAGAGALPVIAKQAVDMGLRTHALGVMPFEFEHVPADKITAVTDAVHEVCSLQTVSNEDELRRSGENASVEDILRGADLQVQKLAMAFVGVEEEEPCPSGAFRSFPSRSDVQAWVSCRLAGRATL